MQEQTIESLENLESLILEHAALLVYFSSPTCNVCKVLRPKVMEQAALHYPLIGRIHVDLSITPEIGAHFHVLAAPTVILFLEGKEFIRKYRTISVDGLMQEIKRPYEMMVG